MKKALLVILLGLLTCNLNYSQKINEAYLNYGEIFLSDVNDVLQTGVDLASQPFSWKNKDFYKLGATIGITSGLFFFDEPIRDFSQKNKSAFGDIIFSSDELLLGVKSLILPMSVYGYGLFSHNNKVRILGLKAGEALVYSTIITQVLKISFGRFRPYNNKGNMKFEPISFSEGKFSLPSGHSTAAFALASVFAEASDSYYWEALCYGSAGLIAVSRVYNDKHWVSDIFLGGVIGYYVGKFVYSRSANSNILGSKEVHPYFTGSSVGVFVEL